MYLLFSHTKSIHISSDTTKIVRHTHDSTKALYYERAFYIDSLTRFHHCLDPTWLIVLPYYLLPTDTLSSCIHITYDLLSDHCIFSIVTSDGSHSILAPSPQGRLGHSTYVTNDDTYPTRDLVFKVSNRGWTHVNTFICHHQIHNNGWRTPPIPPRAQKG